ncbi:tetratricopeptide repeat protein [Photobacterium kagoshimensis]|uniref:tetratricopeptide repeat protein n=1 Tax=Photobacterium kagoshimensis TaxID=2910242 RepID=UPI003D097381
MKFLIVFLLALMSSGCSNSTKSSISDEKRMEITQNYDGLQDNYRARLKLNPKDFEASVKLATTYYKDGDIEAASYYIDQVPDDQCSLLNNCWLTRADIAYSKRDYSQAKYYIDYSLAVGKDVYAVKNLYGIMLARQGQFDLARQYFFEARVGFKSESAIKNNLAMTEMMEGQYEKAAERLMPLYQKNRFDTQIKANLIVSLMLSNQYSKVKHLLLQEMSEDEAMEMFEHLREDLQQPARFNLPALDSLQQSQSINESDQQRVDQDEEVES